MWAMYEIMMVLEDGRERRSGNNRDWEDQRTGRVLTSRTISSVATLILAGTKVSLEQRSLWAAVAYFSTNFPHFQT